MLLTCAAGALAAGSAAAYSPPLTLQPVALELAAGRARSPGLVFANTAHDDVPPLSIPRLVEAGTHWRLDTARGAVHVWIPHRYDPATAVTVLYVHGYYTDVDAAWQEHRLPAQFALSGINAMFIACEAPSFKDKPVAWPSLRALLAEVAIRTEIGMPAGQVVALGHSGAYRTLEAWLPNPRLDTVVLLDAAYGDTWPYRSWLYASSKHRLIDVAEDTVKESDRLHRLLPGTLIVDGFPTDELPAAARSARILYIRSQLGHMPLVTGGLAMPVLLRALEASRILTAPIATPLE